MSCPVLPSRSRWPRRVAAFDAVLLHWLTLGVLVLTIVPAAHWHNVWIGWLPYWLVLVPAVLLGRHPVTRMARSPERRASA
ncbi:hypothetical protein OS187_12505 [Xanthomonadaceae bacterium JHOS43]|nr:hypothetical protein [Xanthomonadaceae bacterium JHOS43]MCX7564509.1 hypothetical protein [Xanthomonadaceae bacterium XH05]